MKCLSPQRIRNKATGQRLWVSCNRCSHCLENRRAEWLLRLFFELQHSYLGVHCTFQFSDDYLFDNVLDKRDLQLFFKRLRHHFDFRYYAIGEYGTQDKRKHYHVAFFVQSPISFNQFNTDVCNCWSYGYVYFTRLKLRRLAYILHYHIRPKEVDGKPTFQIFSKGLGEWFCNDQKYIDFCLKKHTVCIVNHKGEFQPLPRYYRKKFGIEFSEHDFESTKSILDNIVKMAGKPLEEIPQATLSKYRSKLFIDDYNKRMLKYNVQQSSL